MRWVIGIMCGLAVAPRAFAGDFDTLRGSESPTYHWGGVYGGVQGGYASGEVNFGKAGSSEIAYILRDTAIEQDQQISQWTVLGARSPHSTSAGGFVGYNSEWEDVIVGLELNYNRLSMAASSSDSIARSFTDSTNLPSGHHYFYDVGVSATSSLHITDVATFRARAGWEAGCFLPYAFVGFALGRADISTSATVADTANDVPDSQTPPLTPLQPITFGPTTQTNGQSGAFLYGFSVGGGLDFALTSNIFVRAEYEYVQFAPLDGIVATISTARLGAGLKF